MKTIIGLAVLSVLLACVLAALVCDPDGGNGK